MCVCVCVCVCGGDLVVKSCPINATQWTVACQAPLSMAFLRQEYWSGLPFPSAGILLTQGSNSDLPHSRLVSCIAGNSQLLLSHQGRCVCVCVCVCVRERERERESVCSLVIIGHQNNLTWQHIRSSTHQIMPRFVWKISL